MLLPLPLVTVTDFAQQKVRPAAVVQNDIGNRYSANVIIVPISSRVPEQDYPVNRRLAAGTAGLDRASVILAGTILTVPQSLVIRRLGQLPASDLLALDTCLRISVSAQPSCAESRGWWQAVSLSWLKGGTRNKDVHPGEQVKNVRCTRDSLRVDLLDGRTIIVPLAWFPRLLHATTEQRANWVTAGGGFGIHWPEVDEDISVEGLLRGLPAPGPRAVSSPTASVTLAKARA